MDNIQVDMFEVQLGAALLLSFDTDGGTVRVLADAGIKASGYKPDHVLNRLDPILGTDDRRLDLIIGTHYDEDHLNGLVPIINDATISIGEAWMPPVADDSAQFALDTLVAKEDLLVRRFAGGGGDAALENYLAFKRSEIETLISLEKALSPEGSFSEFSNKRERREVDADGPLDFFREQLFVDPDDGCDHGVDMDSGLNPVIDKMQSDLLHTYPDRYFFHGFRMEHLKDYARTFKSELPAIAKAQARSLANLRRSNAKDAINASALHEVVQALSARKIPIRCEIIEDGTPRRYRWDKVQRTFILTKSLGLELGFTLLGPSESLVRKHRDKLPVAETSKIAFALRGEIRSITPSNQLSYIGCFTFAGQSILVTGDAGCVDFAQNRTGYYPNLLAAMKPLHVIQVAHHAGNNAHFYRVLSAAGYPEQSAQSFLLLSHAYHDKTRPSDVFHDFLLTTLGAGDDVKLLFTSEPTRDKVADFLGAIHPLVGPQGNVGDIQLCFSKGLWEVTQHAVEVV